MAARPLLALLALFFTAGALVLMFLVMLAGTRERNPLNQIYFFRADTGGIPNAPPVSQWTMWNRCEPDVSGRNTNCLSPRPAYPFDPPSNFGTGENVPENFIGTSRYFYLTRFMFAFFLISMFFAVCAFFTGLLSLISRLGGALSGLLALTALFFFSCVAALMTSAYVLGRRNFRNAGRATSIGVKAFAFVWTAWVCLLLASILYFTILGTGRKDRTTTTGRKGYFARKKAARDRGSFIETDRRVKEEYA